MWQQPAQLQQQNQPELEQKLTTKQKGKVETYKKSFSKLDHESQVV
jgi:hypothetical protein